MIKKLAWVLACLPFGAAADDIFEREWIRVDTPNFTVDSTLDERTAVELGRFLEIFRIAAAAVTNVATLDSNIPTSIVVLEHGADYAKLGLPIGTAGVYMQGMRDNTIVMQDVRGEHETSIIMHEYVHFLMHNQGAQRYPRWFNEGFAEYLSAAEIDGDQFELGRVPEIRRTSLKYSDWIQLHDIVDDAAFDGFTREQKAMFYAEAWALVHFLINRTDRPFGADMANYLDLLDGGMDPVEAFEQGFGIEIGPLNRDVTRYLNKGRFNTLRLDVRQILPTFEPNVQVLAREQAALSVSHIALKRRELELAESGYRIAAQKDSTRAVAEAGLGDVFKFREDYDTALTHFERAAAFGNGNPYVQLDIAEFWHDMARIAPTADDRKARAERARAHYVAAWELDERIPEVYAMYGETYVLLGDDIGRGVELLEVAERLHPASTSIRLKLAAAYLAAAQHAPAEERARLVLSWVHGESATAQTARDILAEATGRSAD